MVTKTKSKDWIDALFKNVDELKTGNESVNWIYEFLGWDNNAKGKTKSNW